MKNLKFILVSMLLFIVSASIQAQSHEAAIKNDAIAIDNTQTIQDRYTLDLTPFDFQSEDEARAFFELKNTDLVSYRVLFYDNVVMVFPQIKLKPEWTTNDWNTYFMQHKVKSNNDEQTNQPQK